MDWIVLRTDGVRRKNVDRDSGLQWLGVKNYADSDETLSSGNRR